MLFHLLSDAVPTAGRKQRFPCHVLDLVVDWLAWNQGDHVSGCGFFSFARLQLVTVLLLLAPQPR